MQPDVGFVVFHHAQEWLVAVNEAQQRHEQVDDAKDLEVLARRTSTRATGPMKRANSISTPASTGALQPVGGGVLVAASGALFGSDGVPGSTATGRTGDEMIVASDSVLFSGCA